MNNFTYSESLQSHKVDLRSIQSYCEALYTYKICECMYRIIVYMEWKSVYMEWKSEYM